MTVWAYSNCDVVELLLNGRSLGVRPVPQNSHVEWPGVSWEPGTLTARASLNGAASVPGGTVPAGAHVAEDTVKTSAAPARLHITLDWPAAAAAGSGGAALVADGVDAALIRVEVQDTHGVRVPSARNIVSFSVVGPGAVVGVGNGDPSSRERDKASSRRAFSGLVRAVVQTVPRNPSTTRAAAGARDAATFVVVAASPGLASARLTITVLPRPSSA